MVEPAPLHSIVSRGLRRCDVLGHSLDAVGYGRSPPTLLDPDWAMTAGSIGILFCAFVLYHCSTTLGKALILQKLVQCGFFRNRFRA